MKEEARLYQKLPGLRVECHTCQWRCRIGLGKLGTCRMYQNLDGTLYNLNYAEVSSMAIDPIEKKPLFHFHPGTQVFSLGTLGCNFHCKHCQNWTISAPESNDFPGTCQNIPPETAVSTAIRKQCQGIAWTYNEPAIWLEYTLDCAKLAKEHNLYTVYVTNGYATEEALDSIGPYLDAWRVDLKGFSDHLYRDLARVINWRQILSTARRAKEKWGMHLEVVTNIIPGLNDDEQLGGIAGWIKEDLGELTPWHITRFYPHYHLSHIDPTPITTLERAYQIGTQAGLKFIYAGNVPGNERESTVCYACGQTVVKRFGYHTEVVGLAGSQCRFCGAELNFRTAR
ncbi:MAG: AmmeMemoRadiSam system radical SAM enzyme [Dehalococcoidales bacterium]